MEKRLKILLGLFLLLNVTVVTTVHGGWSNPVTPETTTRPSKRTSTLATQQWSSSVAHVRAARRGRFAVVRPNPTPPIELTEQRVTSSTTWSPSGGPLAKTKTVRRSSDWQRTALDVINDVAESQSANCSVAGASVYRVRRLPVQVDQLVPQLQRQFAGQTRTVAQFASVIQSIIYSTSGSGDTNRIPEAAASSTGTATTTNPRKQGLFDSVVRSVVESDGIISGLALILEPEVAAILVPYAYRERSAEDDGQFGSAVKVKHFARRTSSVVDVANLTAEVRSNASEVEAESGVVPAKGSFMEVVLGEWRRGWLERHPVGGDVTSGLSHDGSWSSPWHDCFHGTWMVTYFLPLVTGNRLQGVVMINFDLNSIDVDQCAPSGWLFSDTNLCHRDTMQCIPYTEKGFARGAYECECRPGYFLPNGSDIRSYMGGAALEAWAAATTTSPAAFNFNGSAGGGGADFACLPCHVGCDNCVDQLPCFAVYDVMWRSVPLGLQSFCMTIAAVLGISVFRLRKCKVISAGMWTVLEMILVGALMLYSTVVIRYFEPMPIICLMEPWFREVGFAICYGTIVLKMYRVLVEFRTRKAHRWVVRDKDLLKYLAGIILIVIGYMSAWTAIMVDHIREGDSIIDVGRTEDGLKYYVCKSRWWDYVTEIGELTFLFFGIYISYHIRNATTPYKEKRSLCLAVYVEALVSLALYIFRHGVWLTLHPDYIFLLYFGRCQLTVSITLMLLFGPKLWYHYKPPHESDGADHSGRPTSEGVDSVPHDVMKLQDGITSNGEVDIGEINLADMDPEDIRTELRRVYTQLQILRNKTMRKDNPHISKRRGGRKATHRRFSLQAFHRHRHHMHEQEHDTEISKTPEESTGSVAEVIIVPSNAATTLKVVSTGQLETHFGSVPETTTLVAQHSNI